MYNILFPVQIKSALHLQAIVLNSQKKQIIISTIYVAFEYLLGLFSNILIQKIHVK